MPPNQANACHDCSHIPEKAKEEKVFLVKVIFYRMRSHLFEIDRFKIYIGRSVEIKLVKRLSVYTLDSFSVIPNSNTKDLI